jgi:hypothetical protein
MKRCHACGHPWEDPVRKQPVPKAFCEACSAYLHCCLNCVHFTPGMHNDCYIPTTDWVGDKGGANFCNEFTFKDADGGTAGKDRPRDALDKLFGEESDDSGDDPLDLFRNL